VTSHSAWTNSDSVVFGLPLLAGFISIAVLLLRSAYKISSSKRVLIIFCISAVFASFASLFGAAVGSNMYGSAAKSRTDATFSLPVLLSSR
jgi:hypothetical protein